MTTVKINPERRARLDKVRRAPAALIQLTDKELPITPFEELHEKDQEGATEIATELINLLDGLLQPYGAALEALAHPPIEVEGELK